MTSSVSQTPLLISTVSALNWKAPICGGSQANGTNSCMWSDDFYVNQGIACPEEFKGKWKCCCLVKPKACNYELYMCFAMEVHSAKMYSESASKTWDAFSARLFTKKTFAGHQLILGKTLKEKFRDMMKDCEKKAWFKRRKRRI